MPMIPNGTKERVRLYSSAGVAELLVQSPKQRGSLARLLRRSAASGELAAVPIYGERGKVSSYAFREKDAARFFARHRKKLDRWE